jgi:hydrophobin
VFFELFYQSPISPSYHIKSKLIKSIHLSINMKFSIVAITSVVALVSANPVAIVEIAERQAAPPLCSGTTGTPVCCATDVLGLADLDCATRT